MSSFSVHLLLSGLFFFTVLYYSVQLTHTTELACITVAMILHYYTSVLKLSCLSSSIQRSLLIEKWMPFSTISHHNF